MTLNRREQSSELEIPKCNEKKLEDFTPSLNVKSITEQGAESQDSPTLISGEQIRRQPSWMHCFPLPQSLSSLHSLLQMADERKYVVKSSSLTISE